MSSSPAPAAAGEPSATDWPAILAVIAAGVLVSIQLGKLPPLLTQLRAEFGLGMVLAGLVASSFNLVGAATGIIAGAASDRIGSSRALGLGLLVTAAGNLLGGLADGIPLLLAARLVEGCGFVLTVVSGPSLLTAATRPQDRSLALGLWSSYMPLGVAFGMFGALLVGRLFDWRGLWFLLAAVMVLAALLILRRTRTIALPPARRFGIAPLRRPGPWLLAGCFACYTTQWFAIVTWIPTYLRDSGVTSEAVIAAGAALVVLVNVAGNMISAALMHRGLPRWLIIAVISVAMGAFGVATFDTALPVPAKILLAMAASGFGGMLPAAVLASVPRQARQPGEIATVNGAVIQLLNIGSFLGPPGLAALVTHLGGWDAGRWLLLGTGLASLVLALALRQVERRQEAGS